MPLNRKVRYGMVGGGRGAFIGAVHRMAAALDGKMELVAGCFSADPEKSRLSGQDLGLSEDRVYSSFAEMAQKEAALPVGERIDFVSIVVRNDMHFEVAKAFLEAGIHVVCEKPVAYSLEQALELREIVRRSGLVFALTHNYTGYPMVKEAREFIRNGELGDFIKVVAEYPQGYALSALEEKEDATISNWRMDPSVSGVSNCIGDIGSHANNLVRFITGLEMESLCAELSTFIPGRPLDDDGNMLVRYKGGAKGVLYASQVSAGEENNLNVRIYGTKASLQWHQEYPNDLVVKYYDKPRKVLRRGNDYLSDITKRFSRLPFGHPEAFIEAFANVYLEAARAVADAVSGDQPEFPYDHPTIDDGVNGMAFIETAVKSSQAGAVWTDFPQV